MYAKLKSGYLFSATERFPTKEDYIAAGYKPVSFVNQPDDHPSGYYYESGWEEQTDTIVQTWTLTPLPDDIDEAEAYDIIFGGGGE